MTTNPLRLSTRSDSDRAYYAQQDRMREWKRVRDDAESTLRIALRSHDLGDWAEHAWILANWASLRFEAHQRDRAEFLDGLAAGAPVLFRLDEKPAVWLLDAPHASLPPGVPTIPLTVQGRTLTLIDSLGGAALVEAISAATGARPFIAEIHIAPDPFDISDYDSFARMLHCWEALDPTSRAAVYAAFASACRLIGAEFTNRGSMADFARPWHAFGYEERGRLSGIAELLTDLTATDAEVGR